MPRPIEGSFPEYFKRYVSLVKEDNIPDAFRNQQDMINTYFDKIPEDKTNAGYAPGKWTLKEMLQHLIDAERIFSYRALAFARKEKASLPSFEEDEYAANSHANERSWKSLCNEFKAVRKSTEMMFDSFNKEALQSGGISNNNPNTVLAIAFISVGHVYHHVNVIEERYMKKI